VGTPEKQRGGRPWLCRFGLHRRSPVELVDGSCLQETRCRRCERLLSSTRVHDWSEVPEKDARCVSVVACRRCGEERHEFLHRNREIIAAELRPGDRSVLSNLGTPAPCDVIAICLDCGQRSLTYRQEHDEENEPPYRCQRCGHWYDDGEA
jgi:DNA-directed RNA polymerase subunit M/transcription elongation factor TFIIS